VRATVCTYDDAGVPRVGGLFGDGLGENYLLLEHGNGECSYLGGLLKDSAKVTVGMTVPVGEVLAEVGNSASIGRPALVYRLVRGDVRVADPLTVVPRFEPFTAIFGGRPLRSSQPPEAGDLVNPD
jgi:murein DD-endopeptidase MepM/ murein hydrolase activator NlpD